MRFSFLFPRISPSVSSGLRRWIRFRRLLESTGAIAVIAGVAQYFFTYGDRVAERQAKDWDSIRQVQLAKEDAWKGNVGVIDPLERLTRECSTTSWDYARLSFTSAAVWVFHLPLRYFERDCVQLKSLRLEQAELGSIKLNGAVVSRGSFSCSNLSGAALRGADLTYTDLGGATLKGADLSGANFQNADFGGAQARQFYFTNVSQITVSEETRIEPKELECACIDAKSHGYDPSIQGAGRIKEMINRKELVIQTCPEVGNLCGEVMGNDENRKTAVHKYKWPSHCAAGLLTETNPQ